MPECPVFFKDGYTLGSIFFGEIIGNFAGVSASALAEEKGEVFVDGVGEIVLRLARGGHEEKHDVLRSMLRAECWVIVALCDRILLDDFGLRLGRGSLGGRLGELLTNSTDPELENLCCVLYAFARAYEEFKTMSVEELVRRQGVALGEPSSLIPSDQGCFVGTDANLCRVSVVKLRAGALHHTLSQPRLVSADNFEDPICAEGLPPRLAQDIERHPLGWWDFLRLAFREELAEPDNERVRKAWAADVLGHLALVLGSDYEDFEARQAIQDTKAAAAWNGLKPFRKTIEVAINNKMEPKLGRRPFQLPQRAMGGKLIGREELLTELVQRLKRRKHVVICGGAGMGKSALAAEAISRLTGDTEKSLDASRFPQGIAVLDIAKIQRAEGIGSAWFCLADQFGFQWLAYGSVESWRGYFHRGHALVVIENAEEILDNGLRQFLESLPRGLTALVMTNRQFQFGKEPPLALDEPLDSDAALLLLRTASQNAEAEDSMLTGVSEILGGHPLSLIWAGYQLAAGQETPDDFLKALRKMTLHEGYQSDQMDIKLRWLFDHALAQCSTEERRVLAAAGMLSHYPFPLGAAVAVTRNEKNARQSLGRLAAYGFLKSKDGVAEQWQFCHPIAHEFARSLGDAGLRLALGRWAVIEFDSVVKGAKASAELSPLVALVNDIGSLLRADESAGSGFDALRHRLLHDGLEQVGEVGLRDLARELGLALLDWLKRAVEEWPTDIVLVTQLASSYEELAKIDRDNARDNYEESIKITRRLLERDPNNPVLQRALMQRYDQLGDDYLFGDDRDAARTVFLKALEIAERLVDQNGSDTRRQIELAYSYCKLADIELAAANHDQSRAFTQKAMDIAEAVLAIEPTNDACSAILADRYQMLGELQRRAGNFEGSRDFELKAVEILDRLSSESPAGESLLFLLSVLYFNLSGSDSMVGDQEARRKHLMKCREVEERMDAAQGFPSSESFTDRSLADLDCATGNFAAARAVYERRLEVRVDKARADPTDVDAQLDLSSSYRALSDVEFAAGNIDGARLLLQKSLEICELIVVVNPVDSSEKWVRLALRNTYDSLGDVEYAAGNYDTARALMRKGLEINESLAEWNFPSQQGLLAKRWKLGDAEAACGDLDAALAVFIDTIALCEKLLESDPKRAQWNHELSVTCMKLGEVLLRQKQGGKALEYFKRAELISAQLVERDPNYGVWTAQLDGLKERIAKLEKS